MNCENKEAIHEIQRDIKEINSKIGVIEIDLAMHMSRTKYNEDRIEFIENWFINDKKETYDRYETMDRRAKNFSYKILTGVFAAGLLPFLLKLLKIF
jgi:hypothetical protein